MQFTGVWIGGLYYPPPPCACYLWALCGVCASLLSAAGACNFRVSVALGLLFLVFGCLGCVLLYLLCSGCKMGVYRYGMISPVLFDSGGPEK